MFFHHVDHYTLARMLTAFTLLFLGVYEIVTPRCFWGLSIYFRGIWRLALPPQATGAQAERLRHVLDARARAEGDSDTAIRCAGGFAIAMAGLALVPSVPFVLPYALSTLALAFAILITYLRFRRVTELRVAPLVRRTPWKSLPPIALIATLVCLLGAGAFGAYAEFRISALIVILCALALLAVAWRVAMAPAILFGDDSQLEYLVDEHIRFCRAMNLVSLACAPPTVLVALGWAALPWNAPFFNFVTVAVALAFVTVLIMSLNPMRKRSLA
jgi:hypothetical protein